MDTRRLEIDGQEIHLLGTAEGLTSESEAVEEAIGAQEPDVVAVALAPGLIDEVEGWGEAERLEGEDKVYAKGLEAWGEVVFPPDEYRAAKLAGEAAGARVVGIDMPDEEYTNRYTDEVGMFDLFVRTYRLRRWSKGKGEGSQGPEAYCIAFDETVNQGPFRALEEAREHAMAAQVAELAEDGSVIVVLPVARLSGVAAALRSRAREA